MADVTIKYKGATIAEMSGTSEKTLETSETYCEGDIVVSSVDYDSTGFLSLSVVDVTIGANTVSHGGEAVDYMQQLVGWKLCAAALLDNPTTQNQLIMIPGAMTLPKYAGSSSASNYRFMRIGYRYRDGTSDPQPLIDDYLFVIKEGTKYRIWVCDLNTTNLKPY